MSEVSFASSPLCLASATETLVLNADFCYLGFSDGIFVSFSSFANFFYKKFNHLKYVFFVSMFINICFLKSAFFFDIYVCVCMCVYIYIDIYTYPPGVSSRIFL